MEVEHKVANHAVGIEDFPEADDLPKSCSNTSNCSRYDTQESDENVNDNHVATSSWSLSPSRSVDVHEDQMSVDSLLNHIDECDIASSCSGKGTGSSLLDNSRSSLDRSSDGSFYQTAEEDNANTPDIRREEVIYRRDRMSVDFVLDQEDALQAINNRDRMSVDSESRQELESLTGTDTESPNEPRRTGAMSVDISPRQQRLTEIVNTFENCLKDGKLDEAENLVREQYVILELFRRREEEGNGVDLAEMYLLCADYSLNCGFRKQAIISYYRGLLEMEDGTVQYIYHVDLVAPYWMSILAPGVSLEEQLNVCSEVRKMADDRMCSSEGVKHNVPMAMYNDLCLSFKALKKSYPKNKMIREENLKALVSLTRCLMQLGLYDLIARKLCKPLIEHEYHDSAELFEIWAKCLHALRNFEVALKKAKLAVEFAKDQEYRKSVEELVIKIQDNLESENRKYEKTVESDDEWLEGTNIREPQKNVKAIEEIKEKHVSKPRRRPKAITRHPMDFYSNITKRNWNEIFTNRDQQNKHKSPAVPMDGEDLFSLRKKKRRRRNTGGSEISRTDSLQDVRSGEAEFQFSADDTDDLQSDESDSDSFEFQNSFGNIVESEESEDSDGYNEFDTYYEKSIHQHGEEENPQSEENDFLMKGISLTTSFVKRAQIVDKRCHYSDDLSVEALQKLLRQEPEKYKKCCLQIEGAHKAICTLVTPENDLKEIDICGRTKAGRNFTGDIVVVEILKYPEKHSTDVIPRLKKAITNSESADFDKAYGKIIGRLERRSEVKHPVFVCELDDYEYNLMRPLCKTIPKIRILQEHTESKFQIERYDYDAESSELEFVELKNINPAHRKSFVFLVAYIRWDVVYPTGAVLKIIKSEGCLKKAMKIQELLHQVPSTYKQETLECVRNLVCDTEGKSTLEINMFGRQDLSESLTVFTIDPPNCKDIDDALSVQKLEGGSVYYVGVHIADVANFVKKNDDIDKEAQDRATTFYPGQGYKPFHMLPEPLSENVLSLIPGEKRATLSVFLYMDENGIPLKDRLPEIKKTVIQSKRKFTYSEVQDIITDKVEDAEFSDEIKTLFYLARKNRIRRLGDAFNAFPVESIMTSTVDTDSVLESVEAHYLVEEFMILANGIAARFVCHHFRNCVPLRCQDAPSSDDVIIWLKNNPLLADVILKIQGFKPLPSKTLAVKEAPRKRYNTLIELQKWTWEALEKAVEKKRFVEAWELIGSDELHPEHSVALAEWIRLQETAEYRCLGMIRSKKDCKHFTLNTSFYTNFTSPIRRYIDIIIHRLIHAALDGDTAPYTAQEVDALCCHINEVSKRAKAYKKQCATLQIGEKFKRSPLMFHGFVEAVSDKDVTFHIPGLNRLPQSCRQLPLNYLGVSRKPEIIKDVDTDKDILTLHWQKRLYSHKGYSPSSRGYDEKRLDPHTRAVFQQYNKWLDIIKALFARDSKLLERIVDGSGKYEDYSPQEMIRDWVRTRTKTVFDVSSENRNGPITRHLTNFSMSFSHAQVIGVQVCAEPQKGILVPFPQILDLTKNVKICLQHAMDPVKYLAKYGTVRSKGEKVRYSSCPEYFEAWLPILEMEGATAAAKEDSITVNDLPVRVDSRGGKFTLSLPFCEERIIRFPTMSMKLILTGEDEEVKGRDKQYLSSANFICLKYEMKVETDENIKGCPSEKRIWVGHGKIDKIKDKEKGKRDVYFSLHPGSNKPPAAATSKDKVYMGIEILEKPKSNSRTESIVKCLEKSTTLAKAIALGNKIPKLDNGHMELAKKTDCDLRVDGLVPNNSKQHEAIKKALSNSFSLIQGPPGTGKTYTGIKLVALFTQINQKWKEKGNDMKQVVFCGPSNKSVDLVAKWMIRKLGDRIPRIVRMYGSSLENVDFPVPTRLMSSRTKVNSRPDEMLRDVSLHHLIRKYGKPHAEEIRQYDKHFRQTTSRGVSGTMSREEMKEYREKVREYEKLLNKAALEELKNHDVIFCTTAMATNPKFIRSIKNRVYQCIIDECGMCTEPECIATLIATKAKQVVLIGDHKQLRPVVLCSAAADLGLERSLFERYANWATFLNKQYRMNPRICDFVSEQFYDGLLETGPSVAWKMDKPLGIWQYPQSPHIFCNVEGTEIFQTVATEEGSERSCSNMEEVEKVYHAFSRLVKTERVRPNQINMISQYNAQCHAIREHLASKGYTKEDNDININTVVASQGGEWDYVIFSTVRSLPDYKIEDKPTLGWCTQNLGFITDQHQINVALSRARKGLIIIGNKKLLCCDKVWNNLLEHYKKRGCILDANEFPPREPRRSARRSRSHSACASRQTSKEFYEGTEMQF